MGGGCPLGVEGSGGLLPQILGVAQLARALRSRSACSSILRVRVLLCRALLPGPWRASRDRLAPPHLCRLHIVRDDVLDGPGFSRLRNGQWTGVSWEERGGDARQDQTGEHAHRQDVLLDLLPPRGLGGAKDNALDAVVYAATGLEGD